MTVLTDAYIIKKMPRGDYDVQYLIFSEDLGKISALAKSAKKITSKLAPHLEICRRTKVMIAPGLIFNRVAAASTVRTYRSISASWEKTMAAISFLSALDNLTIDRQPESRLFRLLDNFFVRLDETPNTEAVQLLLNRHYFDLLSICGYQPKLTSKNQSQLTADLCRYIMEASEKELVRPCF